VITTDDDGSLDGASPHEVVESEAGASALAVAQPADARGQALELHSLARGLDPAHQRRVVGELVDDRPVGGCDIRGIAGQRHPPKRSLAFAEKGPDIGGDETRIVECAHATAKPCFGTQAVAVVEDLRAAMPKLD